MLKPVQERLFRHGAGMNIPLYGIDAGIAQGLDLFLLLDAFGHHGHSELAAELGHGLDHGEGAAVVG